MGKLTLEEAIAHAKEVADMNYNDAEKFDSNDSVENYMKVNCMKCAEQHEKLAEWLEELKSYKEAEEQSLLVRLPIKIGDMVWDNDFGYPESYEIKALSYGHFILNDRSIEESVAKMVRIINKDKLKRGITDEK